jgi:integrase
VSDRLTWVHARKLRFTHGCGQIALLRCSARPRQMRELWIERRRNRKTPLTPSQRARKRKKKPARAPSEKYDTRSYYHAVRSACLRAKVPHWHPNQLRHNAATRFRALYGLDTARAMLGHASPAVTAIYAEADRTKARAAMAEVG